MDKARNIIRNLERAITIADSNDLGTYKLVQITTTEAKNIVELLYHVQQVFSAYEELQEANEEIEKLRQENAWNSLSLADRNALIKDACK